MWNLTDALEVIRPMQEVIRKSFYYHVTLGGGILNKGESEKDLDLFFLCLNGTNGEKREELRTYLYMRFNSLTPLRDSSDYQVDAFWHYTYMEKGTWEGKRVDIFIQ